MVPLGWEMAPAQEQRNSPRRRSAFLFGFRRISSLEYWPEIDGLRFLAIALVVVHHVEALFSERATFAVQIGGPGSVVERILQHGDRGVPIFFAISGSSSRSHSPGSTFGQAGLYPYPPTTGGGSRASSRPTSSPWSYSSR